MEEHDRLPEEEVQEQVAAQEAPAGWEERGEIEHSYLGHTSLQTPTTLLHDLNN